MERTKDSNCPVNLIEIKEWNYIEDIIFDNKLQLCLEAAIAAVESYINQIVWPSSCVFEFSSLIRCFEIPVYPVTSVTSVSVDGTDLSSELYAWDGHVLRIDDSVEGDAMTVTVRAGNDPMDQDIKSAVLLVASELFRNPTDSVKQLPTASKLLLDPHRNANI